MILILHIQHDINLYVLTSYEFQRGDIAPYPIPFTANHT